jgi:hypothetical protein
MSRQDLNTLLAVTLPIIFASIVGFVVWKIQGRIIAKALQRTEEEKERRLKLATEHQALLNRVAALEASQNTDSQSLALLKQEMLPMAEAMKRKLVEILTHPSDKFEIPDAIVAKVNVIGSQMTEELAEMLAERLRSTNPHITEQERLAAEALPIIMRLAELEAKDADEAVITQVQLVSSTMKTQATKKEEEG